MIRLTAFHPRAPPLSPRPTMIRLTAFHPRAPPLSPRATMIRLAAFLPTLFLSLFLSWGWSLSVSQSMTLSAMVEICGSYLKVCV
eukprot:119575-Chlamydomonas_euryale.AAC.1